MLTYQIDIALQYADRISKEKKKRHKQIIKALDCDLSTDWYAGLCRLVCMRCLLFIHIPQLIYYGCRAVSDQKKSASMGRHLLSFEPSAPAPDSDPDGRVRASKNVCDVTRKSCSSRTLHSSLDQPVRWEHREIEMDILGPD